MKTKYAGKMKKYVKFGMKKKMLSCFARYK